jgi:hypothetical protein
MGALWLVNLDREAEHVHRRRVGHGNLRGATPEEPERPLEARRAIRLEELHPHHQPHQGRHGGPYMLVDPGAQADLLAQEAHRFLALGRARGA